MPVLPSATPIFTCRNCLIAATRAFSNPCATTATRHISHSGHQRNKEQTLNSAGQVDGFGQGGEEKTTKGENEARGETESGGAMSCRLQEATEEALLTGGKAGVRAVHDAGFSRELKEKLLKKIEGADGSGVEAEIVDAHVKEKPWSGEEAMPDAVLRMLDDAHKPLKRDLRGGFRPPVVDPRARMRSAAVTPGRRAAEARDKASMYAHMGIKADSDISKGLSAQEREELKEQFRARFEVSARAVPATISGLTALANERIEEAIARGQFKHLSRGKPTEADPMASNPFVDTTEYLMNRIIQRQEIVPPWIEKQQELGKAVRAFRVQLRTNWKRHAARMIASRGGTLEEQMNRAQEHAAAERAINDTSPEDGHAHHHHPSSSARPFRDTAWEKAEHSYLRLSVDTINSLTQSYNLMAPELAKKPYMFLQRELASCYADVAPSIAAEIRQRALQPRAKTTVSSSDSTTNGDHGMMSVLRGDDSVRIYERKGEKPYGLREWWRDVWNRE